MAKRLYLPEDVEVCELINDDVELLFLPPSLKRLDIKHASNLKKIIFFGSSITFGPEAARVAAPAFNMCPNLNEIVTCGDLNFNTLFLRNGVAVPCGWLRNEQVPPTITSIGFEYQKEVPFYCYKEEKCIVSIKEAYPVVRECPEFRKEAFLKYIDEKPDEVSQPKFYKAKDIFNF